MKVDNSKLIDIVRENDPQVETEFRRGSTFYATADVVIEDETYVSGFGLSPEEEQWLIGKKIVATGYWSDDNGLDLYDAYVCEKRIVHVPEKVTVIPAHDEVVWTRIKE